MKHAVLPALVLLSLSEAAAAPGFLPMCEGTYEIYSGTITAQAEGQTSMIQSPRPQGRGTLKVSQCGRQMNLTSDFELLLDQSMLEDARYHGQLDMGGVAREFTFDVVHPRLMTGKMEAAGQGLALSRGLKLVYLSGQAPDMKGCQDDPAEAALQSALSSPASAVVDAMQAHGLKPPANSSLSPGDYIWRTSDTDGSAKLAFLIGESGAIVPARRTPVTLEEICSGEAEKIDTPRRVLDFKIFTLDDSSHVFVRVIDLQTGRILEQREGVVSRTGSKAIGEAAASAMTELGSMPKVMSNGKRH